MYQTTLQYYTAINSVLQGITLIPELHTEHIALPHCISLTHQLAALNIALIIVFVLHCTNSALLCASLNVTLHTHYYPPVGCPVLGFKKHCKGKMCKL